MDFYELQEYVKKQVRTNGWERNSIEDRILYLFEETYEALSEVKKLNRAASPEEVLKIKIDLGEELFDIMWNVAEIANRFDIDLTEATKRKVERNKNRDFSVKPFK